jgi:hypothetical protein
MDAAGPFSSGWRPEVLWAAAAAVSDDSQMERLLPMNTTSGEENGHDASLFPLFIPTNHQSMPSRGAGYAVTLNIVWPVTTD